jgi:hypothetical protein
MVVKDFAARSWWRRLFGRREVERECRAYTYVGSMSWFPAFIGRIDSDALAVEKVDGITLRFAEDIDVDARAYRNVLRRPDGQVVFIDLAGSFWIPPGRLGHRLLRRFIALYYEANIIKWETLLAPGGDPRKGQSKPPRYVHGLVDLWRAWRRLRVNPNR